MAAIEQAKEVAAKPTKDVAPVAIILFGSTARSGVGNDLDLLVVTDREGITSEWVSLRESSIEDFPLIAWWLLLTQSPKSFEKEALSSRVFKKKGGCSICAIR